MHSPTYIQRLSQLVAIPSVSSANPKLDMSNLPVVELLANWLAPLGFDCRILPISGHPGKANLLAQRGAGSGGLVLAGHTDTVPCNPELWQQDPFSLTQRHNRLYGLGATDMKGFFPAVLAAVERLAQTPLHQPLIILATADEESSMSGARALVNQGLPSARFAVIGEPTSLRPIRMHKGIILEAIRVQGQSGHSSNPALGINALETMQQVLGALLRYRSELQSRYQNPGFAVPVPTLNLGCIHGGDNPNRICGQCELHFDLRPLPGMDIDQLRADLRLRLAPIAQSTGADIILRSLFEGIAPYEEPAHSELVTYLEALTGQSAESVSFATEAPFLQAQGMQTVVMGPGSIDHAHQPNEFIPLDEVALSVDILERLIRHTCLA